MVNRENPTDYSEQTARPFALTLATPFGKLEDCDVKWATLPGMMGQATVMHDHVGFVSLLKAGHIKFERADGKEYVYDISGGIAHMSGKLLMLLIYSATCRTGHGK